MKTIKLIFCIALMSLKMHGQLNVGLKAYYTFSGTAADNSGQNNNGVLAGSTVLTTDRFGFTNCAYEFPGDSFSFITIPYSADFDIPASGVFSLSLWYQGGTANVGDFETLFLKNNPAITPIKSDYHMALLDNNSPSFGSQYSPVVMPPGGPVPGDSSWHHVVGIYNNKKWFIYKDDTLRDSDLTQTSGIFQSTGDITIGKKFEGKIDDIRFYNRELTVLEINQIYNLPSTCVPAGINDITENGFTISPNPFNNVFKIAFEKEFQSKPRIEVFDMTGKKVNVEVKMKPNQFEINLVNAPTGIYILKIIFKGETVIERLEKQN